MIIFYSVIIIASIFSIFKMIDYTVDTNWGKKSTVSMTITWMAFVSSLAIFVISSIMLMEEIF